MIQRKRWRLSPAEKLEIWRRWKCGQSQHEIGRACGRPHPTIRKILLPCGGIAPAARRRSGLSLTLAEREDISRGIASDSSIREIARLLKRSASTVSREVARHGGRPAYRAHDADQQAWVSALRAKKYLLAVNRKLRDMVASKLILDWSPEQISGWLKTCALCSENNRRCSSPTLTSAQTPWSNIEELRREEISPDPVY